MNINTSTFAYGNAQRIVNSNPPQYPNQQFPASTSFPQQNMSGYPQWNQGQQIPQQQMQMPPQQQFQQQQPPQQGYSYPPQNLMSNQFPNNPAGQQKFPNQVTFGYVAPQIQQQNAYPANQIISQTGHILPQMQQQPYQQPRYCIPEISQPKQQQQQVPPFSQQQNFNQVRFNQANPNLQQQQYPTSSAQPNSQNNTQQQQVLFQNGQLLSTLNQNPNTSQVQQSSLNSNLESSSTEEITKFKLLKIKQNLIQQSDIGVSQQTESLLKQTEIIPNTELVTLEQLQQLDLSETRFILKNNNLDPLCFKKLCFIVQFMFMAISELEKKRTNFWNQFIGIFQECDKFANDDCFKVLKLAMTDFQKLQDKNTLKIKWFLSALQSQISTFALSVLAQFFIKAFVEKDPSLTAAQAFINHFSRFCVVKVVKDPNQISKEKSYNSLPTSVICLGDFSSTFAIFSSK